MVSSYVKALIFSSFSLLKPTLGVLLDLRPVTPHNDSSESSEIPLCGFDFLSGIRAYLLDLDGTMYSPEGLLPGVTEFFDYLEESQKDHILLSNGFKTAEGVAAKFASPKFKINQVVDPENVHTAGMAVANYMKEHAEPGSRVYAIGTGITYGDGSKDSLKRIFERECPDEFATWDFRTDLTMDEIRQWAADSRAGRKTFVVLAPMGNPFDSHADDPVTGKPGYTQLDYSLMTKINTLLRNRAYFVVGSPDVADSQPKDPQRPAVDTAWPTTGGFEYLFLRSAEMLPGSPRGEEYHANVGKGGNKGAEYMMKPAIKKLKEKDDSISMQDIAIIGDNFGTDIQAGNDAGIKTILVLVGAHQLDDAANWSSRPSCFVRDVGEIAKILSEADGHTQPKSDAPESDTDGKSDAPESDTDGKSDAPESDTDGKSDAPESDTDGKSDAPESDTDGKSDAPESDTDGKSEAWSTTANVSDDAGPMEADDDTAE